MQCELALCCNYDNGFNTPLWKQEGHMFNGCEYWRQLLVCWALGVSSVYVAIPTRPPVLCTSPYQQDLQFCVRHRTNKTSSSVYVTVPTRPPVLCTSPYHVALQATFPHLLLPNNETVCDPTGISQQNVEPAVWRRFTFVSWTTLFSYVVIYLKRARLSNCEWQLN
jgi:hypothetical protein